MLFLDISRDWVPTAQQQFITLSAHDKLMLIGVLRPLRCHDSRTSMVNDIILGVLNNLFLAKLGFVSLGQYTVNSERHCYLPLITQLIHSSIRHSKVLGAFSHYNKVQQTWWLLRLPQNVKS